MLQLLEQDLTVVKKKKAINFVFSNRTACKLCRVAMACYKNISTFDMCAQMNLCLYIGQVEVPEHVASYFT